MIQSRSVTNGDTRTVLKSGHPEVATTIVFQLVGIASGSFTPQVTVDGTNWTTCAVFEKAAPTSAVTSITAAGTYVADISGVRSFGLAHSSPTGTNVITFNAVMG